MYLSVNTELVELKNYGMTEFIGVMIELMELNNESSELLKFLDTRLIRVEVNLIASVEREFMNWWLCCC